MTYITDDIQKFKNVHFLGIIMRFILLINLMTAPVYAACTHDLSENKVQSTVQEASDLQNACTPSSEIPDKRAFPINAQINPCDNFFQYACSEALSCFKLREDRNGHIFSFSDASERLLKQKKDYLQQISHKSQKRSDSWSKELSSIYKACMNESAGKAAEITLVKRTLLSLGKIETKEALLKFIANENVAARTALIDFGTTPNLEDSDWDDIVVTPKSLLSLPERSYYHNENLLKDFSELLAFFYKTLGFSNEHERAQKVIEFQKGLAEVYPLEEEIRKIETEKKYIAREKLFQDFSNLSLDQILKEVPNSVIFRDMFSKSLAYTNAEFGSLSLETLKDIFVLKALNRYMDDAYPEFFKKKFEFENKYLGGPNKRRVRDERCAVSVMERYGKELDHEIIENLFPNFPTERFEGIVEKIRTAMIRRVEKNTWLSEKGREGALRKLHHVKMKLVKPRNDKEWDLQLLAAYDSKDRIKNIFLGDSLGRKKMIQELASKRNKEAWAMNPLIINAYYDPSTNTFNMPLGILQYPFFDTTMSSDIENFGGIGVVVGHEIGHGIDDNGAKYNDKGVLEDWMTPEDIQSFKNLGVILVEQYNKAGHNGHLTLGENIADVTGLSFSYDAAFPDNVGSIEDKKAFYLQYARLWCGLYRPAEYQRRLKVDPHSLTEVRVNEPLKHQEGFYEAYSCKAGDKMFLPKEKRLNMW